MSLSWNLKTTAGDLPYSSVAYGNGLYIAVISGSPNNVAAVSSDGGVSWSLNSLPVTVALQSIAFGNGYFVAVGSGGVTLRTTDGVNWTQASYAFTGIFMQSVAYGNGIFVMVGNGGGSDRAYRSLDNGASWTNTALFGTFSTNAVFYGNGLFVSVGSSASIWVSSDGNSWALKSAALSRTWVCGCYFNGLYIAACTDGVGNRIQTSTNGTTWISQTTPSDNFAWQSIATNGTLCVAVANTGTGTRCMTSVDGAAWVLNTTPADNNWTEITFGLNKFIAVANSGTGNRAMTALYPIPSTTISSQRAASIKKVYIKTGAEHWQTLGNIRNGEVNVIPTSSNDVLQNNLVVGSYSFEGKFELLQTSVAELELIDSILDGTNSFLFQLTDAGTIPAASTATEGWLTVSKDQIGVKAKYESGKDPSEIQFTEIQIRGLILTADLDSIFKAAIATADFHISSTANESFSNNNSSAGGTLFGNYLSTTAGDNIGVLANHKPNGISLVELKNSADGEYFQLGNVNESNIVFDWIAQPDSLGRPVVFNIDVSIEYSPLATDSNTLSIFDTLNETSTDLRLTLFDGKIFTLLSKIGIKADFHNTGDFKSLRKLKIKHTGNILTTAFDGVLA